MRQIRLQAENLSQQVLTELVRILWPNCEIVLFQYEYIFNFFFAF